MVMAEEITLKDLEKLSPEERVRVLKKFEEQRKKEIEKAESLLRRTEEEIEGKKKTELEIEEKSKEIIEKGGRGAARKNPEELEEIVREAKQEPNEFRPQYGAPLEEIKKLYEIATPEVYDTIRDMRDRAAEGRLTRQDEERLNFYENEFSRINSVQAAYINDEKKRINIMKAKTALEQIKEYETMI